MAKTAKLKKPMKPSTHSRASRRASSPALEGNLDKSLTIAPRPSISKANVLGPQTGAGISKPIKKKGGKVLKRKQKLRLEQGKEKAEAVNGKLERKIERAEQTRQGKKGRNADWDDLNEKISGRRKTKKDKPNEEDDDWEDEEMQLDHDGEAEIAGEFGVPNRVHIEESPDREGTRVGKLDEVEDEIM